MKEVQEWMKVRTERFYRIMGRSLQSLVRKMNGIREDESNPEEGAQVLHLFRTHLPSADRLDRRREGLSSEFCLYVDLF